MYRHALIVIAGLGVATLAACSDSQTSSTDTNEGPTLSKSGQERMGDEGKLPSTRTLGEQVPTMGTAEPQDPNAPVKRMGDEGKLPATNTMSGAVPDMNNDGGQ
jgi:hypothetical protein